MLREMALSEIPEKQSFGNEVSADGLFAESTLLDFCNSGMMLAEVDGWPSGAPRSSKETARYVSLLTAKIKKHKKHDVSCFQRGRRVFLQKTIVYKMGQSE